MYAKKATIRLIRYDPSANKAHGNLYDANYNNAEKRGSERESERKKLTVHI